MTTTLAEHADTLVVIIGAMWTLLVLFAVWSLKGLREEIHQTGLTAESASEGLRVEMQEQCKITASSSETLRESLTKSLQAQTDRWERHEAEHREFRRDMMEYVSRLGRIEGKQNRIKE